jgi:hypothetical protein
VSVCDLKYLVKNFAERYEALAVPVAPSEAISIAGTFSSRRATSLWFTPCLSNRAAYNLLNKTVLNGQSIKIERDPSLTNGRGRKRVVDS